MLFTDVIATYYIRGNLIIYRSNLIILGAKVRQKIEFHKSERKFFPKVLLIFP